MIKLEGKFPGSAVLSALDHLTLSCMGGFWTDISKCPEGEGDQICRFFCLQGQEFSGMGCLMIV